MPRRGRCITHAQTKQSMYMSQYCTEKHTIHTSCVSRSTRQKSKQAYMHMHGTAHKRNPIGVPKHMCSTQHPHTCVAAAATVLAATAPPMRGCGHPPCPTCGCGHHAPRHCAQRPRAGSRSEKRGCTGAVGRVVRDVHPPRRELEISGQSCIHVPLPPLRARVRTQSTVNCAGRCRECPPVHFSRRAVVRAEPRRRRECSHQPA